MPHVRVKENEPFEAALRRFKRSCEKASILTETRRREYYEKPTTERKRKQVKRIECLHHFFRIRITLNNVLARKP